MRIPKIAIRLGFVSGLTLGLTSLMAASPPDFRFQFEVLTEAMSQPMELELAPDGRIFFNEIGGQLKIYRPAHGDVVTAGSVHTTTIQENGFLGFALDPAFASNQWIYLFYSPQAFSGQRLSRFRMHGDELVPESEIVMLEFGEQRRECCHHAGSVEFGPEGNLFISTGDNTHPGGDSAGYAPIDERPDQDPFDAQKSSANTHDLRGKILRIRPTARGGYTIPEGNLFPADGSRGRPEIYVMGCRNPWRMSVDAKTGFVYWGEVGPDAGGDGSRGSRGYDEINQARQAGNFGWPYFVGRNFAYVDYDYATKTLGSPFDPKAPTNHSPNNTGARVLPPVQPALIYWPYGASSEFPALGQGGRTACAGPVFHFQESFRLTGGFPEHYDNCLLFYDWQRPFLQWARLDGEGNLVGLEPFAGRVTVANDRDAVLAARRDGRFVIQRAIDSQFGPDGCLYLLDYGETWGANPDARLVKVSYQWGNIAPVAAFDIDRAAGPVPLTVALSASSSMDFEGDDLLYAWRLHPGGETFASGVKTNLTLTEPGNYIVELVVRDGRGGVDSINRPVIAGNTPPRVEFLEPREGDFFTPGQKVAYRVKVTDAEQGDSETFDELFEAGTFVTAWWDRGGGTAQNLDPGQALMKQSDCFNCHAVDRKIVGPALLEVAQRYDNDPASLEQSVQRVLRGSSGVWGEVPMLPHEAMHADQVRLMVRWIYGLRPGQADAGMRRGLSGTLTVPSDDALQGATLVARFTDAGNPPAGSLESESSVHLRPRRVQAESAKEMHGLRVLGHFLGAIDHGHYARFDQVNLAGCERVSWRVASAGQGGRIELRAGSPTGLLLSELEVSPTGGWENWVEFSSPLRRFNERSDVCVVFVNPGRGGLMNLDWLQFDAE